MAAGLQIWHFVLPKNGTLVPKHFGDAPLICILIKIVHLLGVTNGVLACKTARNRQL
jgi:hypothetical protein